MSTTWQEVNHPVDFQGSLGAHQTPRKCGALPAIKPYLQTN
jgi:hypothetical protein